MNLIANTGIQFYTVPLTIDTNDRFKMYFHEWFDIEDEMLKLEIAHYFAEDEIWVKKGEIFNLLGLGLTEGKVGRIEDGIFKPYSWDDIKEDFFAENLQPITRIEAEDDDSKDCFYISNNQCKWDKFENKWLPFPFFSVNSNGKSEFAPTNWCRCKLILESSTPNERKYHLLLAFDTHTAYEDEIFEDNDLKETPVFANRFERSKRFGLCNNELSLIDFCSATPFNCEWVDKYILGLFHNVTNIDEARTRTPKMNYLAQYVFILRYIEQLKVLPAVELFRDRQVNFKDIDLIIDMGNSRTCAILADGLDLSRIQSLGLQNLSKPLENGKLNISDKPFDMRLVFREVDFGVETLVGSTQFIFPSMVRLGNEANDLMHEAVDLNTSVEKITTFSSPKRYLWDEKPQEKEWEFLVMQGETNKKRLLNIKGISEHLNSDGSLNADSDGAVEKLYSRKALMTFAFLEILAQAKMQINSYEFRHKWGDEDLPRKLGRIIVTCPTAMSRKEQISLRKCAEDAATILQRFNLAKLNTTNDQVQPLVSVKVVPSAKKLSVTEERKEWIYDEATCTQFVYLFAELSKRYKTNWKEYFDFYGKVRNDLGAYKQKALTIGSVDIGAGTTDVMIAAYKHSETELCNLTPVPLFWESFYLAGDDMLKDLIRSLIIDGEHAAIPNHFRILQKENRNQIILDFFGLNNARQSVTQRQIRSEFNLQIAIPIISYYLELLNENKIETATFSFSDLFNKKKPTERLVRHFYDHFGFSIEDLSWHYNKNIVSLLVQKTFDSLISKIATVISYYGCDIVLLSGRPTSLKPLSDLFLKYYAISPNRLVTLSDYRVGIWYPFHNGEGYFQDAKSMVAFGAMIAYHASVGGGLEGFSLNLEELIQQMKPTTDYFSISENHEAFVTPLTNSGKITTNLPSRIWTRQLEATHYPTRPFYMLSFNLEKIKEKMISKHNLNNENMQDINNAMNSELQRLNVSGPFTFHIVRESFDDDKEYLKIETVTDKNGNDLPVTYFLLQVQSMSESDSYWLDSGIFFS